MISNDVKSSSQKYGIIQKFLFKFINIINVLFFGSNKKINIMFLEKWQIKKLYRKLNYNFLDLSIEKVNLSFPISIYGIYRKLQYFKDIFKEIFILSKDSEHYNLKDEEIFFVDYITSLLSPSDKNSIESIQDPAFFKSIIATEKDSLNSFNKHLDVVLKAIKTSSLNNINKELYYFNKLLILSSFNFQDFFLEFDKQFRANVNYKPKFQAIFGSKAGEHIKSINNYLSYIDFVSIPSDILERFYNAILLFNKKNVSNSGYTKTKNLDIKLIKSITLELVKQISKLNSTKIIELMIKLLTGNLNYKTEIPKNYSNILFMKYMIIMKKRINYLFLKSYDDLQEQLIKHSMIELLKINSWDELDSIPSYNDDINKQLKEKGLNGFSYIFVLLIIKSFIKRVYEMYIRRTINIILLKGDFFNKNDQKELTEYFYGFDIIIQKLNDVEQDFQSGEMYIRDIVRFATAKRTDISLKSLINRYITKIDQILEVLFIDIFKTFRYMSSFLKKVSGELNTDNSRNIKDAKTINNIDKLTGGNGNELLYEIEKSSKSLNKFLELLYRLPKFKTFIESNL